MVDDRKDACIDDMMNSLFVEELLEQMQEDSNLEILALD
jgi:hypothetical protein